MVSADELRAQLKVVELEEKLVAAKGPDGDKAVPDGLKREVREARRVYRTMREARAVDEGTARPGTIEAEVGV